MKLSYYEKRELEELEKKLPILEEEIAELEEQLNTIADYEQIKTIGDLMEEKRNTLEESELRWMELSEKEN